jgi:hypothetical protein
MIKCKTLGMIEVAKNNPILTSTDPVDLYDFVVSGGVTYLVANTLGGDDAYKDSHTFAAGEYLNGFDIDAWVNQELVIDEKHIAYGVSEDYDDITAGTTMLTVITSSTGKGKLQITSPAPSDGYYFLVTAKCTLTEKAVVGKIVKVDKDTVYTP